MSEKVPHSNKYFLANRLSVFLNYILFFSTGVSILLVAYNLIVPNPSNELNQIFTGVLAFLAVVFFLIDQIKTDIFHRAEFSRKNDFIDNSLNTKLAEESSVGYFTNDEIDAGLIKLGVNCFENSFFTKSIANKMFKKQLLFFSLTLATTLFIIIFLDNNIIIEMLLLTLPYSVISDTYRLYRLKHNVDLVFSNFKRIFSSTKESKIEALIIDNTINYEKALSEGGILLDTKIFNKMNADLTTKWEELKSKYTVS